MNNLYILDYVRVSILIAIGLLLMFAVVRRVIAYRRVRRLSEGRKDILLNDLSNPLGYDYVQSQDIFVTRLDAWQKKYGYEAIYDELAVSAGMVFDCFPVYFDYRGKTWLLEFWKGQYGISVGGEIGLYHADHIVKPEDYHNTHFDAASIRELLGFGLYLQTGDRKLLDYKKRHWWLGAFRVGRYIKPGRINALYRIRFFDFEMQEAFMRGMARSGYPMDQVQDQGNCVVKIFQTTETYLENTWFRRFRVAFAQLRNYILNALYHLFTFPFRSSEDRLLFLYYQLPFVVRRMLNIKKCSKFGRPATGCKTERGCRMSENGHGEDHGLS
ncbi:MAG: DUF4474 domain-containing protein [bacterium]|nr:DUF4474 domain-containing protein [bacterium]